MDQGHHLGAGDLPGLTGEASVAATASVLRRSRRRGAATVVVLLLVLSACSPGDKKSSELSPSGPAPDSSTGDSDSTPAPLFQPMDGAKLLAPNVAHVSDLRPPPEGTGALPETIAGHLGIGPNLDVTPHGNEAENDRVMGERQLRLWSVEFEELSGIAILRKLLYRTCHADPIYMGGGFVAEHPENIPLPGLLEFTPGMVVDGCNYMLVLVVALEDGSDVGRLKNVCEKWDERPSQTGDWVAREGCQEVDLALVAGPGDGPDYLRIEAEQS